jgi:hypothetical protein
MLMLRPNGALIERLSGIPVRLDSLSLLSRSTKNVDCCDALPQT